MGHAAASLAVLAFTLCVLILSLSVFLSGFLLRRVALEEHQTCPAGNGEPCHAPPTYNRSILLIVDALRYDFLVYNESLPENDAAPYQNKMPRVHALQTSLPRHTARYRFVADPPTTTMQRLKGLTTGSLPTFVDVGSNFASYVITEDTWLWQLGARGGRAVFAGDDTWLQLFPAAFARAAPYPSFDIRDLDSVDRGVTEQLAGELPRRDWSLFVGHLLGVDHCGHTFGPDHPQMARKLSEVDALVANVSQQLDNDTILFVLGDHGMTRTGDHGGDSAAELEAGLLVVSGRELPSAPRPTAIPQVDIVPTISTLLGLPIPFSNLGTVRAELVPSALRQAALAANVRQVDGYLRRLGWDPPRPPPLCDDSATAEHCDAADSEAFLGEVRRRCARAWATFDTSLMAAGVVLLALSASLAAAGALLWPSLPAAAVSAVLRRALLLTLALAAPLLLLGWRLAVAPPAVAGAVAAAAVTSTVGAGALRLRSGVVALLRRKRWVRPSPRAAVASLVVAAHGAAFFANSFTVREDEVSAFLAATLFLSFLLPDSGGGPESQSPARSPARLAAVLLAVALLRWGRDGFACREEQWWCEPSLLHRPLASLQDPAYRNWRLAVAAASIAAVLLAHRLLLRRCGSLSGFSAPELAARWCGWLAAAGLLACWALQAIAPASAALLTPGQRQLPVLLALGSCGAALLALLQRPLLVCARPELASAPLVPRVFRRLRAQLSGRPAELCVSGLAAAVTAPLVTALLAVWLPLVLLLGDGRAPAAALLLLLIALATALHGAQAEGQGSDWAAAVLWAELASFGFFSTGHQATLPSIQWDAAVAGLQVAPQGLILPGACVVLGTFATEVVTALALPLVLCAPHLLQVVREKSGGCRGEVDLVVDWDATVRRLLATNVLYLTAKTVKLLCCCMAAAVLRRHLMVWKIFAPRLLFESASLLVAGAALLVQQGLVLRTVTYAAGWLDRLARQPVL